MATHARRGRAWPPVSGPLRSLVSCLALSTSVEASGYNLDLTSKSSIKSVASSMTADMLSFYNGNTTGNIPGLLPKPYYWWEAGAMLGALIDYWYYTGDDTYNDLTTQGLLFQTGPNDDYMPPNQTLTEGNDDQGFWGMAVMTAAEYKFPNPPADQPQWLALAQAVFNTQVPRWDNADCNGGLRWQIFTWNNGFNYKNSISQACLFNLAARLALYTGNTTYADWAVKTWDWMAGVKFLDVDDHYYVYDGSHIESNCTLITKYQWSYNAGAFLLGAAAMFNYSSIQNNSHDTALWQERTQGLLNGTQVFFNGTNHDIMEEVACEPVNLCDLDQQSFKAYLSRWMAATTKWAPFTTDTIKPLLRSSAVAAASQCTGGDNGRMCGLRWTDNGAWDGTTGVGQQMAAMEVVLANMISDASAPVTNATGGISSGDPNAGGSDIGRTSLTTDDFKPITTADRAGASILTVLVALGVLAGVVYVLLDETLDRTPKEHWQGVVTGGKRLVKGGGMDKGLPVAAESGTTFNEKGKYPQTPSVNELTREEDSSRSSGSVVEAESVRDGSADGLRSVPAAGDYGLFSPGHFENEPFDGTATAATTAEKALPPVPAADAVQAPAPAALAPPAEGSPAGGAARPARFGKLGRKLLKRKS